MLVAAVAAAPADGQSQGEMGATSRASLLITASVGTQVQIQSAKPRQVQAAERETSDGTIVRDFCLWTNSSTRGYSVTAAGGSESGTFTAADLHGQQAKYRVEWASEGRQGSRFRTLTANASTAFTSTATTPDCSAGSAATATVKIVPEQSGTSLGKHRGSLLLLLAPL
jgi:hypothetical protein